MAANFWPKDYSRSLLPIKANGVSTMSTNDVHKVKQPFWKGVWWCLLVLEVFIYSSYSVLAHLCLVDGKLPFRASSVVLCTELTKIVISMAMLWPSLWRGHVRLPQLSDSLLFAVPAMLYTINNNLSVHMQVHMDPTTYQILGNMKVATTAVLYRFIMKRQLTGSQWASLGLLGVAGVLDSYGGLQHKGGNWLGEIHVTVSGLVMMCIYCWISGLAGVYTEYILKKNYQTSLHVQNILLYMFGVILNASMWLMQQQSADNSDGPYSLFEGFSLYTWIIVLTQALNGLIMSAIMKHSSNITRLFIITCAMLLTTAMSVLIFNISLSLHFTLAFILVILALFIYHK